MRPFRRMSPQSWNRLARGVITGGGGLIVLAVLAIVVFIAREAAPLFGRARTQAVAAAAPGGPETALLGGVDDERRLAYLVLPRTTVFFQMQDGALLATLPHPFADSTAAACAQLEVRRGLLVVGTGDGRAALAQIGFDNGWKDGRRTVTPSLRWLAVAQLDSLARPLVYVAGDRDEDGRVALAAITADGGAAYALVDESGGAMRRRDLGTQLPRRDAKSLALSLRGGLLAVGGGDGTLTFWKLDDPAAPELEDHLRASAGAVTALRFLLGDQALVAGSARGEVSEWFRVRYVRAVNSGTQPVDLDGQTLAPGQTRTVLDREYGRRLAHVPGLRFTTAGQPWTQVRDFERHPAAVLDIAAAPRGRSFATADAHGGIRVQHATSRRTLATIATDPAAPVRSLTFVPKSDGLVTVAGTGRLHVWRLHNPHPEASPGALLGPVWYEGYAEPKHVWQTTGGSDDFEPKFGLVALVFGTLKGTFYALLFSVPIAVLAALYVSQLTSPRLRAVVKPAIELMAAMPSVVVGFLAALWLAPLLEGNLGAALGGAMAVPFGLATAVAAWYALPRDWRQRAHAGTELAFLVPFLVVATWLGTRIGAPLEAHWFAGDLQQWLFDHHGITYDQRNCIVVGIALGFAIIPIIFTISEDAMSAVPPSLTSGALALGASRWQAALHVILPAASPGIFAAIMLGLGRAIGETMIVLMATGNTPIVDLSPFNGMRTMSAGIAVEIPEAPQGGTLYRVLFLTGFLLFCFTFVLNTGADMVGRRLRKRYGQF